MSQFEKYEIVGIETHCPDTKVYRMRPLESKMWSFAPGQFVFIHILDGSGNSVVKKPFSIASAPGGDHLEFCIKLIHGNFTGKMEALSEGSVVGIEKPAGHFTYNDQPKAGFIAGGTGIAPIISMLRFIKIRKIRGEFVFFYSAKSEDHILYRKELEQMEKEYPDIRIIITLTQEEWNGEKGRVDAGMISRHLPNAMEFNWWICGPTEMVKSMRQNLESLGADPKMMKMEGWG